MSYVKEMSAFIWRNVVLFFVQISLREAYKGTKKVGLGSFTRKAPVTATSHVDTSNNAHSVASHKPAATATFAMTAAPTAAAAAPSAATNWPQVCSISPVTHHQHLTLLKTVPFC